MSHGTEDPLKREHAIAEGWRDLKDGVARWRVATALAREDIGDQHRRTALGPLWLVINYLAFAGTFIFVFERGDGETVNYAAYVAIGLFVWFYIMETLTLSVTLFNREESFIKGTTLPISVYVLRLYMQSLIRSSYALGGCLLLLALAGEVPHPGWLCAAAGLVLVAATSPAAILLCAFLGAFVPDTQFVVSNFMRLGMFLTPVFWTYEGSGGVRHLLYYWNPFTYFLEIVRLPILTGTIPVAAFAFCIATALVLWLVALALLGRFRRDLVFVL